MILVSGQARYRVLNLLSLANRPTLQPILQSVLGHFEDVPLPAEGGSAPSNERAASGREELLPPPVSGLDAYFVAYARA